MSQHLFLSEKLVITLGGHIKPADRGTSLTEAMLNALQRELREEINVTATPTGPEFAVFDPRSRHLAVAHRVTIHSPIFPNADEFSGGHPRLMSQDALAEIAYQLDPWSASIITNRSKNNHDHHCRTSTEENQLAIYQDYSGVVKPDLATLAKYRTERQAPLLDGVDCPAVEYTFAVSDDDGRTWHNPSPATKQYLKEIVRNINRCCLNLDNRCPLRN